jgi:hypothetical protein
MQHSFRKHDADSEESRGHFTVVTKKRIHGLEGDLIWLLSGEYQPRQYRLECWFVVDDVSEGTGVREGIIEVSGKTGARFRGGILLNNREWFRGFRRTMGNFGLGFQLLQPQHVILFKMVVEDAKGALPPN